MFGSVTEEVRHWTARLTRRLSGKESAGQCGRQTRVGSLGREDPLEEGTAPHSSVLAWGAHGQRGLQGYSPRGRKESDTT